MNQYHDSNKRGLPFIQEPEPLNKESQTQFKDVRVEYIQKGYGVGNTLRDANTQTTTNRCKEPKFVQTDFDVVEMQRKNESLQEQVEDLQNKMIEAWDQLNELKG